MRPFAYARPKTLAEAVSLLSDKARPKGGGYDLLDLAKRGVSTPETMVDLQRVGGELFREVVDPAREPSSKIWFRGGTGLGIGAGMTLAQVAASRDVQTHCPALVDAILDAATPQVRNVATLAGNLLQRPRCAYFRDPFFDCLKRGGKTCPAKDGVHDEAAIFGNSLCCAIHPSNIAVALSALESVALLFRPAGVAKSPPLRPIGNEMFFVRPEEDPLREVKLEPAELLQAVLVVSAPASAYVEVNQKQSYDWAAASCAAVLTVEGGKIASARIVLGAVAPIPWRVEAVEKALAGVKTDDTAAIAKAAALAAEGATPLRDNAWKVRLVPVVVRRAVAKALERAAKPR